MLGKTMKISDCTAVEIIKTHGYPNMDEPLNATGIWVDFPGGDPQFGEVSPYVLEGVITVFH